MNLKKFHPPTALLFLYFLIPKIDLVSIPFSVTGIRLQDMIALLLFPYVGKFIKKRSTAVLFFLLLCHLIYSMMFWGETLGILAFFRFIEYTVIGVSLYKYFSQKNLITLLRLIGVICLLQYNLLIPNIDPGRGIVFSNQYSGFYGTPAELSYAGILITALLLSRKSTYLNYLSSNFYLFNGVKAALAGAALNFYISLKSHTLILTVAVFSLLLMLQGLILDYLALLGDFLRYFIVFAAETEPDFTALKGGFESNVQERSLGMRVGKWGMSLVLLLNNPIGFILGFGMYSQGGALDGGVLRLWYEFGLIGIFVVSWYLRKIPFHFALVIISVNLLFDAYMSSVTMPLIIFLYLIQSKLDTNA